MSALMPRILSALNYRGIDQRSIAPRRPARMDSVMLKCRLSTLACLRRRGAGTFLCRDAERASSLAASMERGGGRPGPRDEAFWFCRTRVLDKLGAFPIIAATLGRTISK